MNHIQQIYWKFYFDQYKCNKNILSNFGLTKNKPMFAPFIITNCKLLIVTSLQTNIDLETMHVVHPISKLCWKLMYVKVCERLNIV